MTHECQSIDDSHFRVIISQEENVADGGRGQVHRERPCLWILEAPEELLANTARELSAALRQAADFVDSIILEGQS